MGKMLLVFFVFIFLSFFFLVIPSVQAKEDCSLDPASSPVYSEADYAFFIIDVKNNQPPGAKGWKMEFQCGIRYQHVNAGRGAGSTITASILRSRIPGQGCEFSEDGNPHTIQVKKIDANNNEEDWCKSPVEYTVIKGSAPISSPSLAGGQFCEPPDPNNPGIKTAIGCIHTNPGDLIQDVLKFGVGIGGGLAFLMMLLGAFQMLTSAGNPETLQAGRDRLTSAIIGLLFIIFAVLLLQIIGVDILGILQR